MITIENGKKTNMNDVFESRKIYKWLSVVFQILLFWVVSLVSGCSQVSFEQIYNVSEAGYSIEKPINWRVEYFERSGLTVVETKNDFWQKDSARIEIYGNACLPSTWANKSIEAIESNIERIRILYNLESVTVIQEPSQIETEDFEIIKAVIAIPSGAMADDTSRIHVGDSDPETQQMINLFAISDQVHSIMAYIYEGEKKALNTQAQDIIDSVQFNCSKYR